MWLNQYEEIGIILNQRQPIAKPTEARTCPHMGWAIERRICAFAVEEWRTPLHDRLQSRISHSLDETIGTFALLNLQLLLRSL